jgi:lipid-A-disaccharide synthase-like uncharacterized protein
MMQFFGKEHHWWEAIGWLGNIVFSSRFFVQWYATEKKKQVTVPTTFWWLSLIGSLLLLIYAIFHNKDIIYIFAYAFAWIPYIRNLVIHRRHAKAHADCPGCETPAPPNANFCAQCGQKLEIENDGVQPARR